MIKADIVTEVSPIVGSERQSEELMRHLLERFEEDPTKIWELEFFGRSFHDILREVFKQSFPECLKHHSKT